MTESLQVESMIEQMRGVITKGEIVSIAQLRRRLNRKVGFREGHFRAALWQLIDGCVLKFTEAREIKRVR